jgi:hypothetical protein
MLSNIAWRSSVVPDLQSSLGLEAALLGQLQSQAAGYARPLCAEAAGTENMILDINTGQTPLESTACTNGGMNSARAELIGLTSSTKATMLITLVAILRNGQVCLEKVVMSTMTACQVNAQIGIAAWLANGPYHEWRLKSYKCVLGNYVPKGDA